MGIAPYKTFTFDGTSSSAYGVYLTGEGVFNAPVRAVEMIEIPGRNGNFALDQGRFENIQVTYKAGIYDLNESNFADKVSAVRNWLCSKVGYCRLEDEYNPNEYRMAVYSSGLEVTHDMLIAGEFEITFECKPQRWLTSGETETAVANNGTLSNPTLFPASPLIAIWGYGEFTVGGETLELVNSVIGPTKVYDNPTHAGNMTFDTTYANAGDRIYGDDWLGHAFLSCTANGTITSATVTTATDWTTSVSRSGTSLQMSAYYNGSFSYGTASTKSQTFTISAVVGGSTKTLTYTVSMIYDGSDNIRVSSSAGTMPTGWTKNSEPVRGNDVWLDSTTSTLGSPTYVDLDIGEAYMISGGSYVNVNGSCNMPSVLPTLAPGTNTFTYDNTITTFKVTPRWWKV